MIRRERHIGARGADRKGGVLVLVCLSFVLLAALAALAIDVGWMFLQEARFRKACSAAAVAGANKAYAGGTPDQIRQTAKNFAAASGLILSDVDIQINPAANCAGRVRITHREPVGLFFAPLLGAAVAPVSYSVSALAAADVTPLFSEPAPPLAASAVIPLYIPHADLMPILEGTATTPEQVAGLIFGADKKFEVGRRYLLKSGSLFQGKLQAIVGQATTTHEGALALPGPGGGADRYRDQFLSGYGGRVAIGDAFDTQPGTMAGPTQVAVETRVGQDPGSSFGAGAPFVQPLSARMVVVLIANAMAPATDDAGTGIEHLGNIGQVWDGDFKVKVVGLAQFFLDPYSTTYGTGVVTGVFVRYVGTPPSGQSAGQP